MSLKQFFLYFILHSIVFTMFVFIVFYIHESGDMNTVLLGTSLYLPYVLLFSGLNLILVRLGLIKMTKQPLAFLAASFMSIALVIWLLVNGELITVRYWGLTPPQFIVLNIVTIVLNLLIIARWTSTKQHKKQPNKERQR